MMIKPNDPFMGREEARRRIVHHYDKKRRDREKKRGTSGAIFLQSCERESPRAALRHDGDDGHKNPTTLVVGVRQRQHLN